MKTRSRRRNDGKCDAVIANIITLSRIPFSLLLLVLPPKPFPFAAVYLLCGITDVLDGFLARRLHTESKAGERLDSIADLFFALAYAVKILPLLCLPVWVLIWAALIAGIKIIGILKRKKTERKFRIAHSFANRLTGLLLFLLPLTVHLFDVKYSAAVVCTAATAAAAEELFHADTARQ